jgi:hypothetical protein
MELLGMTEVEKPALTVLLHRFLLPEEQARFETGGLS